MIMLSDEHVNLWQLSLGYAILCLVLSQSDSLRNSKVFSLFLVYPSFKQSSLVPNLYDLLHTTYQVRAES